MFTCFMPVELDAMLRWVDDHIIFHKSLDEAWVTAVAIAFTFRRYDTPLKPSKFLLGSVLEYGGFIISGVSGRATISESKKS